MEPHRDLLAALAIELHEVGEVGFGKIARMRHAAQVSATDAFVQDFRTYLEKAETAFCATEANTPGCTPI
ncbi:MAG: hypothetical protein ACJ78X_05760, partial [Myxococcales bacterium]